MGESRISYREATHLTLADKFVPSALRVHWAENSVCCRPKRGGVSPLAQSLLNNGAMRRREIMGMLPIVEYTDTDEGAWLAGVCFATSPLGGITANLNFELGLYRNLYPYIYF